MTGGNSLRPAERFVRVMDFACRKIPSAKDLNRVKTEYPCCRPLMAKEEQRLIYLDYSANTPVDPEVLSVFSHTESSFIGNPNSSHRAGEAALAKLAEVTDSTARMLRALPSEIIYTSGASEANNFAVKGIARTQRNYGKHIISTALEHPSVSGPLTWLGEQGYEIDLVRIGRDGKIDLANLRELMREDTILVAVTAVDSELGTIQPVREVSEIVRQCKNCRLHVDATQAVGKIPFSFEGMDTASLAAHKFYGLNGSGLLIKREELVPEPLIHGGTGANLYRSGTPTLGLAAALETALRKSVLSLQERHTYVKKLNERLRKELSLYPSVVINSPKDAVPHILNISVTGVKGGKMQQMLSEKGVCISVKSACSTDGTPSRAVYAVSHDRKNALSSWRISLSHLTTDDEITGFLKAFDLCLEELTA